MSKVLLCAAILAIPLVSAATEYRTVERPREECWNEQVPVQSAQGPGGAIIGGIAGGIIGNQVGRGNGRTVATAVGAMTGAVVGDRMSRGGGTDYQNVRRCRTVMDQVQVPVVRRPEPVYVQPAPVYYIEPAPVMVQPGYYVVPAEPVYYREHWKKHKHRHHVDYED